MNIEQAKSYAECFALLKNGARPLSGGTNIFVDYKKKGVECDLVDLSLINSTEILLTEEGLTFGAGVTFHALEERLKGSEYQALYEACYHMSSPQIRNRATIAGNLCDGSPAADSAPALLALDAVITLISEEGERLLPMTDFYLAFRKTAVREGELIKSIFVPKPTGENGFIKVGLRNAMAISVASLAYHKSNEGLHLAMGSVAPTPVRLYNVERCGLSALTQDICPINDQRATADYRMQVAKNLIQSIKE